MASPEELPAIDLRHLARLTDGTGLFQHAFCGVPDLAHGYCTDDNARALIAATLHAALYGYDESRVPLCRYLAFLAYAFDAKARRFRNFMTYDRRWIEEEGSDDSHGRALWALGLVVRHAPNPGVLELALRLFRDALPAIEDFGSIRAWAFALVGLDAYLKSVPDDAGRAELRARLARRLLGEWRANAADGWPWPEDLVTYDNAKLPHALVLAGARTGDDAMLRTGLAALRWLLEIQTAPAGHLSVIGNHGWMKRGGKRARFDQQPLEAFGLVHACLAAAQVTGDESWTSEARRAFGWFLGANDLGRALYDAATGGCRDGLGSGGLSLNEGAESTLAYLLSVLELHMHAKYRP